MDAGEGGFIGADMALLQHIGLIVGYRVAVSDHPPLAAIITLERALADAFDQMIVAHAIGDEIADRADLHVVLARKFNKIVEPRHAAVFVHDLTDDTGRVEPCETRNIHRCLGMTSTHQSAPFTSDQRENMARRDNVIRPLGRIDGDGDRARSVGC